MTPRTLVIKKDHVVPLLMVYWTLIAPAPLLNYFGLRGIYSTAFVLTIALTFAVVSGRKLHYSTIALALGLFALSLGNVLHWGDYRYFFYPVFLLCAMILVDLSSPVGIRRFSEISTKLLIILLIGAVFAVFLVKTGLKPQFVFPNPDGRPNYFFYTTFTNSYIGNYIRPAGIFDEPGAFSMYICFIAALRHLLRQDRRTTWLLLAMGFVTSSLAHVIYTLCHLLAEQPTKKRIFFIGGGIALAFFVVVITNAIDSSLPLLSRLRLTEDTARLVAGDNRSFRMINAWAQLSDNPSAFLFGLDSTCVFKQSSCQGQFGPLGENPLSPLVFGGILSVLPYYLVVLNFLIAPVFNKRNIVLFGMGLLFLQRPYVLGFSYAFIATLLMYVFFRQATWGRRECPESHSPTTIAPHAVPASQK